MKSLPLLDLAIIFIYLLAMVLVGFYFSGKNKSAAQFTKASGTIPGWAIGISIYATFLSSNTFLGVPGKAFGSNWNSFVFSISMPFAAWIASKYFVTFYRSTGEISAYTHLEKRFGPWARLILSFAFYSHSWQEWNPLHYNMVIVVGTITIFLTGLLLYFTRCKLVNLYHQRIGISV